MVYRDPGKDPISFGDIFESDHLIDVYVASDASPLGGGPMPRKSAEKIADHNNLELTDFGDMIPVYTPAMEQHPDRFHVLGRGSNMKLEAPNRAILLTDSCAIDTALVVDRKGRRKRGRLLFAPVAPAKVGEVDGLVEQPVFGRFPLAKNKVFKDGAIAELRYCFMVDVRDVNDDDRILALTEEAAEDLEVAWNAYALRRGPLATEHNAAKLRAILAGNADLSELEDLAEMIGEALNVAWRLEGCLADAAESPPLNPEQVDQLTANLKELEEAARLAHERLSSTQPG